MIDEFECTLLEDGTCYRIREDNKRNGKDSIREQFCKNANKNACFYFCNFKNYEIKCLLKPKSSYAV